MISSDIYLERMLSFVREAGGNIPCYFEFERLSCS